MVYLEITIATTPKAIEAVAEELTKAGFAELVLEDQSEFESFLEENRAYWDYIDESLQSYLQGLSQIKLYLEESDKSSLSRLEALLEELRGQYGDLSMTVTPLADTDWEESWKDNYPPQPIGEKLIVLPYWRADETDGRLPVILDPGLTFGTGAHPSTQMVMENMEQLVKPGFRCLDLGSGSGILSITALRLGAASAVGVDIDPKAESIARENAAYNGFQFTALTGNVTADKKLMARLQKEQYDLVLVNIVADVIIGLAPILPNFLQEESVVILSGILNTRLGDVKTALTEANLTIEKICTKEEWCCVIAKRSTK
ncbi:MAG: 50S ribosomal protein L11 methyltransferase [Oscillospiraceae bacterium]|nr:50S ribosomal protein L11 methyltransferase [Oscillospiraceae bacterium]MBQ7341588.1 50S ribosomal protein L11 methyltransferase [Oscillospiraceae bacterium]